MGFFFDKTNEKIQKNYKDLFGGGGKKSKLSSFGWYNSLFQASKGDITKMEEIEKMPFYQVMTFLLYDHYLLEAKTPKKKRK